MGARCAYCLAHWDADVCNSLRFDLQDFADTKSCPYQQLRHFADMTCKRLQETGTFGGVPLFSRSLLVMT